MGVGGGAVEAGGAAEEEAGGGAAEALLSRYTRVGGLSGLRDFVCLE